MRSKLLVAVGIALLTFVPLDLLKSMNGRRQTTKFVVVDGVELSYDDFKKTLGEKWDFESLSPENKINYQNYVVEQMIKDHIMNKEFDSVGMTVTDDELHDQFFGENPNRLVAMQFRDPNGNFDRESLMNYMQWLENANDVYRENWNLFEEAVRKDFLYTKFSDLLKDSYYVPTRLAKRYYDYKETKVTAEVVGLLYTAIPDSLVTVTDQDYKDHYEKYKYRYDYPGHRSIEYVVFDQYDKAKKFFSGNKTYEQFNAAVEAEGLVKRVQSELYPSTLGIPAYNNSREIVRWAYEEIRREGDIGLFDLEPDNVYVVAVLTDIIPDGYVPLEKLVDRFRDPLLKKKKAEMAAELMKAYGADYERMVRELGAEMITVSGISIETINIGKFGGGSNVIGTIMGMKEGEVVGPIAGDASAFIITKVKPETPAQEFDYNAIVLEKKSQFNNRVKGVNYQDINALGGVYEALRDNAKIEDFRTNFF